ncbi:MAG: hypothetical protein KKB70_04620 [Proteobacteria bacterium]|nr:hypothetical protein [Pseudomonadota bacterium]MBU1611490.1 hypothetical protein [Pseudomonadota bacterium]
MSKTNPTPFVKSPWSVIEVFVLFLIVSTVGEFMGAYMGEYNDLSLAVIEMGIGLALAFPALSGKRWALVLMGLYLIYYGLCTFWLLLEGGTTISWIIHGPLSIYLAAGGLNLLFFRPPPPEKREMLSDD